MSKRFRVIVEQVRREDHEMILDEASALEALDNARSMVVVRNKNCPLGTIFSVKKVEEIENE
jgi:hypothetical protein